MEVDYCMQEMERHGGGGGGGGDDGGDSGRRLAVKFDAFAKDFGKAMKRICRDLLECDGRRCPRTSIRRRARSNIPSIEVSRDWEWTKPDCGGNWQTVTNG